MASPQTQHGYLRLANELVEAIYQYPFTGTEVKIVLYVLRKTYGWRRKSTKMTFYEIAKETNQDKSNTRKKTLELVEQRVLYIQMGRDKSLIIGLNKNYEDWANNLTLKDGR